MKEFEAYKRCRVVFFFFLPLNSKLCIVLLLSASFPSIRRVSDHKPRSSMTVGAAPKGMLDY